MPDEPGADRRSLAQCRIAVGPQSRASRRDREIRVELCLRRQNHADQQRLRQVGLQWRRRVHHRRGPDGRRSDCELRRDGGAIRVRGARLDRACIRGDDPQEPRIGVSSRRDADAHRAFSDAEEKPALYRIDPRAPTCRSRRPTQGGRDRRKGTSQRPQGVQTQEPA